MPFKCTFKEINNYFKDYAVVARSAVFGVNR